MTEEIFSYHRLLSFTNAVFEHIGCTAQDASIASRALLSADLRGIDSHGIARLNGYVRLWEAKRANPTPDIKIIHETPSTAVVDGDGGLGLVVAPFAMEIAIRKAEQVGTGWVSVQQLESFRNCCSPCNEGKRSRHDRYRDDQCESAWLRQRFQRKDYWAQTQFAWQYLQAMNLHSLRILQQRPRRMANWKFCSEKIGRHPRGWIQDKYGGESTNPHELKSGGALVTAGWRQRAWKP